MLHPFSRRHFLKGTALALGAFALNGFYGTAHAVPGNVLVAYFSWSGNTRGIARLLHQKIGGELVEIEPATPYSEDYNTCLEQAKRDQERAARPELKTHIADMPRYDVVFLGYPNWWYGVPMALLTFLEENDLSGKQVYLFCSHGTGGLANSVELITEAAPGATISENVFHCYEEDASSSQSDIQNWLSQLGY